MGISRRLIGNLGKLGAKFALDKSAKKKARKAMRKNERQALGEKRTRDEQWGKFDNELQGIQDQIKNNPDDRDAQMQALKRLNDISGKLGGPTADYEQLMDPNSTRIGDEGKLAMTAQMHFLRELNAVRGKKPNASIGEVAKTTNKMRAEVSAKMAREVKAAGGLENWHAQQMKKAEIAKAGGIDLWVYDQVMKNQGGAAQATKVDDLGGVVRPTDRNCWLPPTGAKSAVDIVTYAEDAINQSQQNTANVAAEFNNHRYGGYV